MKRSKLAQAGIERTKDGELSGFNLQWLASDRRQFSDILSDWISQTAQGDADKFIDGLGLSGALSRDDIIELISGDKAPSRELTQFLCATVPSTLCNWLMLRNKGYKAAANDKDQVTLSAPALNAARFRKLQAIVTAAPQEQVSDADNGFTDWLAEIIDKKARRFGLVADMEKSFVNVASVLGISVAELKGMQRMTGDIEKKAWTLASLLDLEADDFNEAVDLTVSAWSNAAQKTDLTFPKAIRFLRHLQDMTQKGFAKHLHLHRLSIRLVEEAIALPHHDLQTKLTKSLDLSEEEQSLLLRSSTHYVKATQERMRERLEPVVRHFAGDGLTINDMMDAARKRPQLLTHKSETIIKKIEAVTNHFRADGMTVADYFNAMRETPAILFQKPERIIGNIESVATHFKADGLTTADYLHAAIKRTRLLLHAPKTVIGKIERVVNHFKAEGMTLTGYLDCAKRQPALFHQKSKTVIGNIEDVVNHFKAAGLTTTDYLHAARLQPTLFYQDPTTLIKNINMVIGMYEKELIVWGGKRAPKKQPDVRDHKPVLNFLITSPMFMCLSQNNYMLRTMHLATTQTRAPFRILSKAKGKVEDELRTHLGHADKTLPVPKTPEPEGLNDASGNATGKDAFGQEITHQERLARIAPHAKNMLLRALIREHIVAGELWQDSGRCP